MIPIIAGTTYKYTMLYILCKRKGTNEAPTIVLNGVLYSRREKLIQQKQC